MVGAEVARQWEMAIRQALMPVVQASLAVPPPGDEPNGRPGGGLAAGGGQGSQGGGGAGSASAGAGGAGGAAKEAGAKSGAASVRKDRFINHCRLGFQALMQWNCIC